MAVGMESVDSWWSQTAGASCGGLHKWKKEARVTLSLSDFILSAFGKYRGFQKESECKWIEISRCTKETFLRDYLDRCTDRTISQQFPTPLVDPSTSDLKSEEKQQYIYFSPKCPFLDFENVEEELRGR